MHWQRRDEIPYNLPHFPSHNALLFYLHCQKTFREMGKVGIQPSSRVPKIKTVVPGLLISMAS